tara:strand:+ start:771 stop:902 length:132 start_codon:yes stop_codon:yes gene_type:complete
MWYLLVDCVDEIDGRFFALDIIDKAVHYFTGLFEFLDSFLSVH